MTTTFWPAKQKISADNWRIVAQEGRIFDLETVLESDKTPRSPFSTPVQVTFEVIIKEIRSINERLDKHDKDIAHAMQTQHRDTDDIDMFGASARPKFNPAPRIKTSPYF